MILFVGVNVGKIEKGKGGGEAGSSSRFRAGVVYAELYGDDVRLDGV